MLEYTARGWKQLPNDVTRFYCDTLMDIYATCIEWRVPTQRCKYSWTRFLSEWVLIALEEMGKVAFLAHEAYVLQHWLLKVVTMPDCSFGVAHLFLCPRHKMARGHLVFALSVIPSFRHSVIPSFRPSVIPSFRHIKVCLLNSSYILAWIWMKLGTDVVPQV